MPWIETNQRKTRNEEARYASSEDGCIYKDFDMGKGDNKRGNKEIKKPKQVKAKVSATANANAGKPALVVAGKKIK